MAGISPKAGFKGLVTATGEVAADPGALRVADNVTLRKQGALSCRPTFAVPAGQTSIQPTARAAFPYRGGLVYIGTGAAFYNNAHANLTYNGSAGTQMRGDVVSVKEARGNLYVPTRQGVFKLTSATSTPLFPAGQAANEAIVVSAFMFAEAQPPALLAVNQQVAYRLVVVRTDPNGVVTRSRPTGAVVVQSTPSATGSPGLSIYMRALAAGQAASRTIEIYRSRIFPTTAAIDDEMQLVHTANATGSNALNISGWTDRLPDAQRGVTLYTSPSRGGMEAANDRPPGCAVVERYRGALFFGNIAGPQRIVFSYKFSTTLGSSAAGVGERRNRTCNATAGSLTITNISDMTGLQVGMIAWGQNGPMGPIASIAGSSVTIAGPGVSPALSTVTGQNVTFYDGLQIGTDWALLGGKGGTYATTSAAIGNSNLPIGTSYSAYEITPPAPGYDATVVIEQFARGGAAFELKASHGDEMSPAIALVSASTGTASSVDEAPNGLAWSEPDEPEHVPPRNFARVGDREKAILGLVALRDSLLIIKEDGLFRLSGTSTSNYRIDTIDTTALCVCPGSIKRLANDCYFLSNLGLVRVDDQSVTLVSRPIQNEVAAIVSAIRAAAKTTGLYQMPGLTGIVAAADDANAEYWLLLGTSSPSFGGHALVYNAHADGWTTYTFAGVTPTALATDGEGQPNVLAGNALLTPSTTLGAIVARVQPHAWADPAVFGRFLSHFVAGFSQLTGTTSVQVTYTSSESMIAGTSITEALEAPVSAGLVQLPAGSLLRHPIPRAMARAYLLFAELTMSVNNGSFVLELMGTESRENAPNHRPTHASGAS